VFAQADRAATACFDDERFGYGSLEAFEFLWTPASEGGDLGGGCHESAREGAELTVMLWRQERGRYVCDEAYGIVFVD